ncbi:ubiquitin carboxy terminal hydrolase Ubp7 [Schizosaccharomyces japonicus yFS275]|uniref:Ubiquitin carboxyl-terminal hydrolase n=1 Tax=Schizosaccharomyces japonicus (strain yFS275 / FY16936) TaxID=402676 RepID=B6JWG6_SCHJY|nr:ubiquitin carboxy terminal hydrolase Ubp7 [Schizosaccharomyces japonicus yFS275]EEB05717.1 ubiquitin carboxy terminal hydrolase Ubp7 [Schizosaccharomyces japonicus yFS275]
MEDVIEQSLISLHLPADKHTPLEASAEERSEPVKVCPHLKKSVKLPSIKSNARVLRDPSKTLCVTCSKEGSRAVNYEDLMLCTFCGYLFCADNEKQHVQAHMKKNNKHCVAMNLVTRETYCSQCEMEVKCADKRNLVLRDVAQFIQSNITSDVGAKTVVLAPKSVKKKKKKALSKMTISVPKPNQCLHVLHPGLQNLGATCYFNSVMQVLTSSEYIHDAFSQHPFRPPTISGASLMEDCGSSMLHTFVNFLQVFYHANGSIPSYRPSCMFSEIQRRHPHFTESVQQDAHELFRVLLDELIQEELKENKRRLEERTQAQPSLGVKTQGALSTQLQKTRPECSLDTLAPPVASPFKTNEQCQHTFTFFDAPTTPIDVDCVTQRPVELPPVTDSTVPSEQTTVLGSLFSGNIVSVVMCSCCHNITRIREPIYDLSLPIMHDPPHIRRRDRFQQALKRGFSFGSKRSKNMPKIIVNPVEEESSLLPSFPVPNSSSSALEFDSPFGESLDTQSSLRLCSPNSQPGFLSEDSLPSMDSSFRGSTPTSERHLSSSLMQTFTDKTVLYVEPKSVHECLENFVHTEKLEGDNMFACEECYKLSKHRCRSPSEHEHELSSPDDSVSEKQPYVFRKAYKKIMLDVPLSRILVLHLKRFTHKASHNGKVVSKKLTQPIEFTPILDMNDFVLPEHQEPNGIMYRLTGIIVHAGTLDSGHYTCYVLSHKCVTRQTVDEPELKKDEPGMEERQWLYISDSTVKLVTWEEVSRAEAYMLFYERL